MFSFLDKMSIDQGVTDLGSRSDNLSSDTGTQMSFITLISIFSSFPLV